MHLPLNLQLVLKQALLGVHERQPPNEGAAEGISVGALGAEPLGALGSVGCLTGVTTGATRRCNRRSHGETTGAIRGADPPHTMVNVSVIGYPQHPRQTFECKEWQQQWSSATQLAAQKKNQLKYCCSRQLVHNPPLSTWNCIVVVPV
jgi:hypothetical protein